MRAIWATFFLLVALQAADRAILTGTIADAAGMPLEHATVLVYHAGVKVGYSTFCPSCYADCGKRAVTDAKGGFTIENLSPDLKFELLVMHDGYVSKLVRAVDPAKGPAPVVTLAERQTVNDPLVRGRLIENGKPLAGAEIGLIPRQRGMAAELNLIGSPYQEIRIGTQADGTFIVTNVPPDVEWFVYGKMESIAPRGGTVPLEIATKTDSEDVNVGDLQIQPGVSLRGKVVLSDGKEIAPGMRVTITRSADQDSRTIPLAADGSFAFAGLAPGKYQVWASVRGYRAPEWDYRKDPDPPGTIQVDHAVDGLVVEMHPGR